MRFATEAFLALSGVFAHTAAVDTSSKQASLRGKNHDLHHRLLSQTTTTGTFLIADTQFPEDVHSVIGEGNPVESTARKLEGRSGEHRQDKSYHFMTEDGQIYTLKNFRKGSFDRITSGSDAIELPAQASLSANGSLDLRGLGVGHFPGQGASNRRGPGRNLQEDESMTDEQKRNLRKLRRLAVYEGDKSVLAVRVIATDGETTSSEQVISNSVFGNGVDPVNLASQYGACSHGKLNIVKPPNQTANGLSISNGVVTVNVPSSTTAGDVVVRNDISSALASAFGVPADQLADHLMYCLPPGTMGGIAYAFMDSWMSVYSDLWCNYVSAQLHEVGHNLNFGHSSEGGASYADQSGMMGYSYGSSDTPVMCFNGPKSWQSGWYSDKALDIFPNADAGTCFSGPVYGVDSYSTSPAGSKVLLRLDSNSGTDYFIAFNGKQGINSGNVEDGNMVLITTGTPNTSQESWKVAKLSAGQTYTISNYDNTGRDVTITVNSVSGSESADVSVQCGPALCSADSECDDFNVCTTNTCDEACTFIPISGCCGNGICEPGSSESYFSCFEDCADGPYDLLSNQCTSCSIQDGNMFDVEAKGAEIAITSLKMRTYATGLIRAEVWTKSGTHSGFEFNRGAWTKILDQTMNAAPWTLMQLPDFASPVDIAAGTKQAFYVTHEAAGDVLFHSGTSYDTVSGEDSNLRIYEGTYNVYDFGGKGGPVIWNGELTYMKNGDTFTMAPTPNPTAGPTKATPNPTDGPTPNPTTPNPTPPPTFPAPTPNPTPNPTPLPTPNPTPAPTPNPTTAQPTPFPTPNPTPSPTSAAPTPNPTPNPTPLPTPNPTPAPTPSPTTAQPTPFPTSNPTNSPVSTIVKYVCAKNNPGDPTICQEGSPVLGSSCLVEGESCGKGGRVCHWAACPDTGTGPNPPPTSPPTPTPEPPTGCAFCSHTNQECCGTCVTGGKPQNRGCF